MPDATLPEAVRRGAAQVRAAFGTVIGENTAAQASRAKTRPGGGRWWRRRGVTGSVTRGAELIGSCSARRTLRRPYVTVRRSV